MHLNDDQTEKCEAMEELATKAEVVSQDLNSESEFEQMDKLEFSCSDSLTDSNDSGNITANASCANDNDHENTSCTEPLSQSNEEITNSDENISLTESPSTQFQTDIDVKILSSNEIMETATIELTEELSTVAESTPTYSYEEIIKHEENSIIIDDVEKIENESIEQDDNNDEIVQNDTSENIDENCALKTPPKSQSDVENDSTKETASVMCTGEKMDVSIASTTPICADNQIEEQNNAQDDSDVPAQNESIASRANENEMLENVDAIATPSKLESTIECSPVTPKVTECDQKFGNSSVKCTPRKFDISVASITPSKSTVSSSFMHGQIEITIKNVEQCADSFEVAQQEENATNAHENDQSHHTNDGDVAEIFLTPAKIPLPEKVSTITKSSCRKPIKPIETEDVECTPRKLNVSLAPLTPCKDVELQTQITSDEPADDAQNSTQIENENTVTAPVELIPADSVTEEEIPMETETVESNIEDQSDNTVPITTDIDMDILLTTPVKVENVIECHSAIDQSTDQKLESIDSELIVKNTPEKMNVSFAANTPCKSEMPSTPLDNLDEIVTHQIPIETSENVQSEEMNDDDDDGKCLSSARKESTNDIEPTNEEESNVNNDVELCQSDQDSGAVSTPVKMESISNLIVESSSALTESMPSELNVSTSVATPCKFDTPVSSDENLTSNIEPVDEKIEVTTSEFESIVETSTHEQPLPTNLDIDVETPEKTELNIECKSSVMQSSRQKQLIFGTPVEKLTPKKSNAILASNTPCKSEIAAEISIEMPQMVEDVPIDDGNELLVNENEHPELITVETNAEHIVDDSPTKVESIVESHEDQIQADSSILPVESEEISEMASNTVNEIMNENENDNNDNVTAMNNDDDDEPTQSHDAVATPAKTETICKLSDNCSSITRSTRRKPAIQVIASPVVKRTPRKLQMTNSALVTATKSETPAKAEPTECVMLESKLNKQSTRMDIAVDVQSQIEPNAAEIDQDSEKATDDIACEATDDIESEATNNDAQNSTSFSTPVKIELMPELKEENRSSSSRSTRRNVGNATEITSAKRITKKLNISIAHDTPIKLETTTAETEKPSQEDESVPIEVAPIDQSVQDEPKDELDIALTPVKMAQTPIEACNSAATRSSRRERTIMLVGKRGNSISATPIKSETPMSAMKLENKSKIEDQLPETIEKESTETQNAIADRSKSPVAAQTPRKNQEQFSQNSELSCAQAECCSSEMNENIVESNGKVDIEPNQNADATPTLTKSPEKRGSSVTRSSKRNRTPSNAETPIVKRSLRKLAIEQAFKTPNKSKTSDPIQIDLELQSTEHQVSSAAINEPAIELSTPAKIEQTAKSEESISSPLTRSTRRRQANLKIGTPANDTPQRSMRSGIRLEVESNVDIESKKILDNVTDVFATPVKVQSITKTDDKLPSNSISSASTRTRRKQPNLKVEEIVLNDAIISESKTPSSTVKRRGARAKASNQSESITVEIQNPIVSSDSTVECIFKSTDVKIQQIDEQTPISVSATAKSRGGKRAGTPLPATKKPTRKLAAIQSQSKAIDVDQPANLDAQQSNEIMDNVTIDKESLSYQNPDENVNTDANEKESAPAKATRRKRANTLVDTAESTPKRTRTRAQFIDSGASQVTRSTRSLRNQATAVADEDASSNATPKKTRGRKKQNSESNSNEKSGAFFAAY